MCVCVCIKVALVFYKSIVMSWQTWPFMQLVFATAVQLQKLTLFLAHILFLFKS